MNNVRVQNTMRKYVFNQITCIVKERFDPSPPQRFKHSLYQSAVRSVPQAQSRMDRSGGEPLPDVRRFLVHPCRFLVHRWISRLWLHLTA